MSRAGMLGAGALGSFLLCAAAFAQQPTPEQMKIMMKGAAEGARTWAALCESCHGPPNPNTPPRTELLAMTADHIYESLTVGKMKVMGDTISDSEKRSVSMYLTGKFLNAPPLPPAPPAGDAAAPQEAPPPVR